MFIRIVGGVALAVLAGMLIWQQNVIRQLQRDWAQFATKTIPGADVSASSGATEQALEADSEIARTAVPALQLRIVALEARVQTLALELEREFKRQRELAIDNISVGPAPAIELKEHILDTKRGLKERFGAFRTLVRGGLVDAQTTTAFVDEIVALNDDELTAELFNALDNTGNLAAAPALIKGLQSDKVELRMRALDALSEMQSDATVVQWLQHVARSDTEERVRAEAVRVLAQAGNQP